jgi:hypothetical protein
MRFLVGLVALFPLVAAAQVPPIDTAAPTPVVVPPITTSLINSGIGGVGLAQTFTAPELDPASLASALTLIGGGLLVFRGRRYRK